MNQVEIIMRTLHILAPEHNRTGTGFGLDIDGQIYFITARHLVRPLSAIRLSAMLQGSWHPLDLRLVGHCDGDTDISVLSFLTPALFSPGGHLHADTDVKVGEEAFFFGFPHGLGTQLRSGHQAAFVKQALVSGLERITGGADELIFLDGHNNPGFSGGPVVVRRDGELKVTGVVSGYREAYEKVYGIDNGGEVDESRTVGYVGTNTGIVLVHGIGAALDLVRATVNTD